MGGTLNEAKLAVEGRGVARGVTYSSRLPALLSPESEPYSVSGTEKVFVTSLAELAGNVGDGA